MKRHTSVATSDHQEAFMPQYALLLYNPVDDPRTPEEMGAELPKWGAYTQGLHDKGQFVAGEPLQGLDSATTVRVRGGETQLTDGPFAETKEYINGFYLVDVPDLDTALALAANVPLVGRGSVEVRPVMDFTGMTAPAGDQATANA
jgi:hypothetical protein